MALAPNKEVLFIEDDENDMLLIKRALAGADLPIRITFVQTFEQAQAVLLSRIITRRIPAVVVTDLKLTGQDGFEVLTWIRQQRTLCAMPVWILTSSQLETDRDKARHLGAAFFVKPRTTEELTRLFVTNLHPFLSAG